MGRYELDDDISHTDFLMWEMCRQAGYFNMASVFDVSDYTGLSVEKCRYILRNYSDLKTKYTEKQ